MGLAEDTLELFNRIVDKEQVLWIQAPWGGTDSLRILDVIIKEGKLQAYGFVVNIDGRRARKRVTEPIYDMFDEEMLFEEEDVIAVRPSEVDRLVDIPVQWFDVVEVDEYPLMTTLYCHLESLAGFEDVIDELVEAFQDLPESWGDGVEVPYGGDGAADFKGYRASEEMSRRQFEVSSQGYINVHDVRKNDNGTVSAYGTLLDSEGNPLDAAAKPADEEHKHWVILQPHVAERLLDETYELIEQFGE